MMRPELRFSTFMDKWEQKTLGQLVKMSSGGTPSRKESSYWNGDIPWITTSEVANQSRIIEASEWITQKGLENSSAKIFPVDTVLVALYGQGKTRGKVSMLGIQASTNQACLGILPNDRINLTYIYHFLNNNYEKVRRLANSGSQDNLSMAIIKDLSIRYPSLSEQQKIADFFTLLDQRIEKQKEKVEAWREYKKGMMQKLFSRELRFRDEDGQEFPVWSISKLEKLSIITMGQSPNGKAYSDNPKDMVLIQGNADMKNGFIIPRVYTSEITKTCDIGDIIMSVRAPVGALAKSDVFACIGRGVCSIRANNYIYHYLYYFNEIEGWQKLSQGSTFESVNSTDIKSLDVPTPSQVEQDKIADYLSLLDKKVECEAKLLKVMKEQKKGFMQKMFI